MQKSIPVCSKTLLTETAKAKAAEHRKASKARVELSFFRTELVCRMSLRASKEMRASGRGLLYALWSISIAWGTLFSCKRRRMFFERVERFDLCQSSCFGYSLSSARKADWRMWLLMTSGSCLALTDTRSRRF